jgi:glycosyltransferase involved in cell wall biosynthesis
VKFSILLPTRNRLSLLKLAIGTVLSQDYPDWEIVVSDNASSDDVAGYLRSLEDRRIRWSRTESAIPVTDNWNRALDMSTGDYIVMLGDDDGLLPGYFTTNKVAIERFGDPEVLYVQGVQFVYAGVMPGHPKSFIQVANCEFVGGQIEPYLLDQTAARQAVRKSASFRVAFPYNMQYWLISRRLVERMRRKGGFFKSPYPDYYAANSILLEADKVVVQPLPLVAVGISRQSFGYYYFSNREQEGVKFLQGEAPPDRVAPGIEIPGSNMNTSWLLAMQAMQQNFGESRGLSVSVWRYRYLQIRKAYVERKSLREFLRYLWKHARPWEVAMWLGLHLLVVSRSLGRSPAAKLTQRELLLDRVHCAYPKVKIYVREVDAEDIFELYRQFVPLRFLGECHAALNVASVSQER